MVWNALLPDTSTMPLALAATTLDGVLVWSAVALIIGLIAWREYTLPDIDSSDRTPAASRAAGVGAGREAHLAAETTTPAASPPLPADARPVA